MEIRSVDKGSFLVKFNDTEFKFVNELAFKAHNKVEKVIADLTFLAIVTTHAQMRVDEMIKTHDEYWDH